MGRSWLTLLHASEDTLEKKCIYTKNHCMMQNKNFYILGTLHHMSRAAAIAATYLTLGLRLRLSTFCIICRDLPNWAPRRSANATHSGLERSGVADIVIAIGWRIGGGFSSSRTVIRMDWTTSNGQNTPADASDQGRR